MARINSTQRKINRCYYWTPLTWEQCIDRHMGKSSNDGGPQRLVSYDFEKPQYNWPAFIAVIVVLAIAYKFS
jgi:hypothetical protein